MHRSVAQSRECKLLHPIAQGQIPKGFRYCPFCGKKIRKLVKIIGWVGTGKCRPYVRPIRVNAEATKDANF